MKKICVYCGSSPGNDPEYVKKAKELGKELALNNIEMVYGGGNVGMMGIIANSVVENNGSVIGVITEKLLQMEVAFTELSDLRVVTSMHERKALMADLADGFIAMPGGFGTMDEMFEVMTWTQLNIHQKPCGFFNVNGYYDKLIDFIDHMISCKFVNPECRGFLQLSEQPSDLISKMLNYNHVEIDKGEWAKELKKTCVS